MSSKLLSVLRIGSIVLATKFFLVGVMLLAMYTGGSRRLETLWLGGEVIAVDTTIRTQFNITRPGGVLVNHVYTHAPLEHAGLRRGDVIVNLDTVPVYAASDLGDVLAEHNFSDSVVIVYIRDGITYSTTATLDYRPRNTNAPEVRSLHSYRVTPLDFIALVMLGLVSGTLSGMIGCGGGAIKVSLLMVFFGFEIFLAKVVSLLSCGLMSVSSSYAYTRDRVVDKEAVKYLVPSAIVGALIGIGISMVLSRHVMELVLGVFLIYSGLDALHQIYKSRQLRREGHDEDFPIIAEGKRRFRLLVCGVPMGIASSVLGITGGVLGTPMQRYLLNFPMRTCIANTVVTVVFVSLVGGLVLMADGLAKDYFSMQTVAMVLLSVTPGSIVGGQIGARVNARLPLDWIKGVYAAVVLLIAARMLF